MCHTTYKPEELILPFVHINGSGARALCDQREAVWNAIEEVREALFRMCPNGRDYYPYNDPAVMDKAVEQHQRRLRMLDALQDEMAAEMEHIVDKGQLYSIKRADPTDYEGLPLKAPGVTKSAFGCPYCNPGGTPLYEDEYTCHTCRRR